MENTAQTNSTNTKDKDLNIFQQGFYTHTHMARVILSEAQVWPDN